MGGFKNNKHPWPHPHLASTDYLSRVAAIKEMKKLILILGILGAIGFLVERFQEKDVVGTYEGKDGNFTNKWVVLANGVFEGHSDGEKIFEAKWKLVYGDLHVTGRGFQFTKDGVVVFRINKGKSITTIADIENGSRQNYPKEEQFTYKKIK